GRLQLDGLPVIFKVRLQHRQLVFVTRDRQPAWYWPLGRADHSSSYSLPAGGVFHRLTMPSESALGITGTRRRDGVAPRRSACGIAVVEGVHLAWEACGMVDPSGTVTFLFTDIEGSTRLGQQDELAMGAALARHDELVRKPVAEHGGVVFSTMGDGIAAAFASASGAVNAAVAAQRSLGAEKWPTATPLRVRMGIHTGEAE